MEDQDIMRLFFERSENAIAQAQSKYGRLIRKIALNILGNPEDAEEIENEVYLKAWNAIPPQRPGSLSAWLCRVSRNLALNELKKMNSEKRNSGEAMLVLEELSELIPSAKTLEDEYDDKVIKELIDSFLEGLDPEMRKVFIGRYYFFDSVKTISEKTGNSVKKVRIMLEKSRKAFADYLAKEGYDEIGLYC